MMYIALGYFDSIHLGHRELLKFTDKLAKLNSGTSAVYTFSKDDIGFFKNPLYNFEVRNELLHGFVDKVYSQKFDSSIMNKSAEHFLNELLDAYNIKAIVCGFDYRFGKDASGDALFMKNFLKNRCDVYIMPPYCINGEKVSTSLIKKLLLKGDITLANELLGQPYFMRGTVVHGRGVGSKNGFPTANIQVEDFLPLFGVYKTSVIIDNIKYKALTSIGSKPTFDIYDTTIETMLIDYNDNLYGKQIQIEFIKYLRPIRKFDNPDHLKKQIDLDMEEALC